MIIPFFDLKRQYETIKTDIEVLVKEVLSSGKYVLGEKGELFEKKFADFIGDKYAVGVNSGTDAIKIALHALGVNSESEVITVSNTAVPTVSAIRELGATPVFVDIDSCFTIDTSKIEGAITSKTKAIVVVHLYGQAANMNAITMIAKKHSLLIVEDCAQATGTLIDGKHVGTFGDAACFSFYPTKNLGAYGDGGMITTSNSEIANTCRMLRMYGMKKGYFAEIEGFNSRLDEIQATILSTKLDHLDDWNEKRRRIADYYCTHITNKKILLPQITKDSTHSFHLFVIRTSDREALKKYLEENGVGCAIHYPYPIHLQDAYLFLGHKQGSLPETEKAAGEILSIPIFPELTTEEQKYIVKIINAF